MKKGHIRKQELHIQIGCADARDLSHVQLQVIEDKRAEYLRRGIHVDFQVIRAAGSFVTHDVFEDIKHIILQYQVNDPLPDYSADYFVHIQTHGHLTEHCQKGYLTHIYDMEIVEGSPLNCGMLGATGVGVALEQLLIEEELIYTHRGDYKRIRKDSDIRTFLKDVYAYDGYLAGDFIKSIDYLRTHPRSQRAALEKRIESDPELKNLPIKITAGLMDYSIHGLIRVDGGDPAVEWWDDCQKEIRKRGEEEKAKGGDILDAQSAVQKPLAGLICMADPRMSARDLAAMYYYKQEGLEQTDTYLPNSIFNMSGAKFDVPESPVGPYTIAGFYYAVAVLGLTDQMVMGFDEIQTRRIMRKIYNDPMMDLVVKKFKVNLIPLNQVDLLPESAEAVQAK